MSDSIFTALEISRCIDCTPQNIRKMLGNIPSAGVKVVKLTTGEIVGEARSWSFDSLPSALLVRLAKQATRHGFATPLQLLQNSPRGRALPSLSAVSDAEVARAQKLQRLLAPILSNNGNASVAELARLALADYSRAIGRVSDRHLRSAVSRVLERDGGNRNFARIELYLSERPSKRTVMPAPLSASFRFPEFDDALATIGDRTRPTLSEIAYCWRKILDIFSDRIAGGANERRLKRALREYIVRVAPFLGENAQAVKRTMNRKIREAIEHGINAITDRRINPIRQAQRPADFDEMIRLLARHTLLYCGNRESQAYRQLHLGTGHNSERFSDEFRAAYPFDCRRAKSRIPTCVRNAVQPMVAAMKALHLGPHAARLALPSTRRDWSEVLAGEGYTSDDVTINRYVYDWHEKGEYEFDGRRFNVVRPQFLPVLDERTGNPLGFSLAPSPTYNSWQIRTLLTRVCMRKEIGLPFERFVFERGIWTSRNVKALTEWAGIDESFARYGVRLSTRHATTPKAKVIEQAIGAIQNLDEYAPGYIGRGEQRVKYERVQSFLQKLKRAGQPMKPEVDPAEMLMSHEQCTEMLVEVLRRFANEPQNGERLQGLSPSEGWAQLSGGRAHVVLPESLRFLLATAESVQTVRTEGVVLRIGRLKHYYCGSAQLGALIGEKVRVRYNPEIPEQIAVSHIASDPRGIQPFSVPLFERVPAHGASSAEFQAARAHQTQFVSYGRALYRELVPNASFTIRRENLGSDELRASGVAHNRLERECIQLNDERAAHGGEIGRLAASRGLSIDARKVRRPARVAKHLRTAKQLEAKIAALEGQ